MYKLTELLLEELRVKDKHVLVVFSTFVQANNFFSKFVELLPDGITVKPRDLMVKCTGGGSIRFYKAGTLKDAYTFSGCIFCSAYLIDITDDHVTRFSISRIRQPLNGVRYSLYIGSVDDLTKIDIDALILTTVIPVV